MIRVKEFLVKLFDERCLRICLSFHKGQEKLLRELVNNFNKELVELYPEISSLNGCDFNFYVYFKDNDSAKDYMKALLEKNQTMILMYSTETNSSRYFSDLYIKQLDFSGAIS